METLILQDLYDLAYRSHTWSSFSPEKRAESIIKEYSEELSNDLKEMTSEDEKNYTIKYREYLINWLHAKGRTASSAVTGPANFPYEKNRRNLERERTKYEEFRTWREKALTAISKKYLDLRSDENRNHDYFEQVKKHILESFATIYAIDTEVNTYTSRKLIIANLSGFIDRIATTGNVNVFSMVLELIKEQNTKAVRPVFTDKHHVWELNKICQAVADKKELLATKENKIFTFDCYQVIFNYQIDRIQIKHDSKPNSDIITLLRKNAFKWSSSKQVWQRQLTRNAIWSTERMLQIKLD